MLISQYKGHCIILQERLRANSRVVKAPNFWQMETTAHITASLSPGHRKQDPPAPSGQSDSHAVSKRLQSELMSLMASADPGVSAFPDGDSLFSWLGSIQGVQGTVYESLSYKLSLKFPSGMDSAFQPIHHVKHP